MKQIMNIFTKIRNAFVFYILTPIRFRKKKFFKEIIYFGKINKAKKFCNSFSLTDSESDILESINKYGFSYLPKEFFLKEDLNSLKSYSESLYDKELNNIEKILAYKNIRAINKNVIYEDKHIARRIMFHPSLIKITSKYLSMLPNFRGPDIVVSRQITSNKLGSQYWHIDDLDTKILKLFIYLTDVEESDYGPFIYSEKNKKCTKQFKILRRGHISDKALINKNIKMEPNEVIGKKFTAFLIDTHSNPHRGSIKLKKDRIVYVCTYTTHSHWSDDSADLKVENFDKFLENRGYIN